MPTIVPAIRENKIGPIEPNHSTDSYLNSLTHIRNGSELFVSFIDTLPRDKPVVIFVNAGNSSSEFLGMLVAYFSWPLEVRIREAHPDTFEREIKQTKASSISGFFFCSIKPPPSVTVGAYFSSEIVFVPVAGSGIEQ